MSKEKEVPDKIVQEFYNKEHKRNKDRIRYGIAAIIIVPVIFLILLFTMNSSKIIYLVLWIASLFLISGYLIAIEYKDYNMTEQLKSLLDNGENDSLIDTSQILIKAKETYDNMQNERKK
ncbi:MAG: hypothetical protein ACI4DS_01645 [Eubacterium sp.]